MKRARRQADRLVDWIRKRAADAKALHVPVSGGSDSALGLLLCARAFPDKTVGVHVGRSLRRADWFADVADLMTIEPARAFPAREEHRWAHVLEMSLAHGAWLVGCRNRTEDMLDTYSLASRVATFLPLVGVWKSDVMRMCESLGVPEEITASSRRADPDCGRPPELAEIPFEKIDAFLDPNRSPGLLRSLTSAERSYLQRLQNRNAFKRTLPIRGPNL
jgi:NH3-dependent NAD+ synthetase